MRPPKKPLAEEDEESVPEVVDTIAEPADAADEGEPQVAELVGHDDLGEPKVDDAEVFAKMAPRSAASIARLDPLRAYMNDVMRHPLLTPEETQALAERYAKEGDVEAAAKLVTSNLRLVVKMAYGYRQAYKNLLDLIQEGNIGLMQAVKKYDPYRGVKLSTYASWWIRAYMLRFILHNHRLVKLGTTAAQRKLFFNLSKEKQRLAALGIDATPDAIAKRLDVSEDDVVEMDRRMGSPEMSLDAPSRADDASGSSRIELLPSRTARADDALADGEIVGIFRDKVDEFRKTLAGKEQVIFEERLMAEEPKTLQELGDKFGVSRERVRQLEKRLQEKLKRYLKDQLGDGVLEG